MAKRARTTDDYRKPYTQRQGTERTMSQSVRAFGLCRPRYHGLAETKLPYVTTAAPMNLDRMPAWFTKRPTTPTRTSRFAVLTT